MVKRSEITKVGRKTLDYLPSVTFTTRRMIVFNVAARNKYSIRDYKGIRVTVNAEKRKVILDLISDYDKVLSSLGYKKIYSNKRENPAARITNAMVEEIGKHIVPYVTSEFHVSLKFFLHQDGGSVNGVLRLAGSLDEVFEVLVPRRGY